MCCPINSINLEELFGETTTTTSTTTTLRSTVPELSSRLLTVDEGCGFSNATHTRIVGGEPAMIGNNNDSGTVLCVCVFFKSKFLKSFYFRCLAMVSSYWLHK